MVCNYNQDEFRTNDKCPMCADYCPVPDDDGVCIYENRVDECYKLTPRGCLFAAILDSDVKLNNSIFNNIWNNFTDLMKQNGYVKE